MLVKAIIEVDIPKVNNAVSMPQNDVQQKALSTIKKEVRNSLHSANNYPIQICQIRK